ncbi:MAG: terminase large subunit, partial [Bryobacteraceae bacterium]|nr:terminase large subunit [Bryobacteraceae bacterium]
RAKQIPAQAEAFRRLYLNQWGAAETRWLEMSEWDACAASIDEDTLAHEPCFGGLDLSSTTDLTAFVLAWPIGNLIAVRPWFWIPAEGIREREQRDRVPYREWIARGFVETTPGAAIDQRFIARRVIEICSGYLVRAIGYDPWGARAVEQDLRAEGLEVIEIRQGYAGLSAATKELQRRTLRHEIRHGGNPVLRWNLDGLTVSQDPQGNIRPVKVDRLKSTRRIDGAVSLIMALECVTRLHEGTLDEDFFRRPLLAG